MISTFGQRFRYARDFQRASGRWTSDGALASELGLDSQSQISAYKRASDGPPAGRVRMIARRTGVDPGWLMFGAETAAPEPQGFETWLANQPKAKPHEPPMIPTEAFKQAQVSRRRKRKRA